MHQRHPVPQVHGLVDVMRDKEHRGAPRAAAAQQLILQLGAGDSVERGKGLIEQQQGGLAHQGPRQRHPALLPAGQLAGMLPGQRCQAQLGQQLLGRVTVLRRGLAQQRQRQQHIVQHRQPVQQRERLEHYAQLRAGCGQAAAGAHNAARLGLQQASNQLQQAGLAAAAAAQQAVEGALRHLPAHAIHNRGLARVGKTEALDINPCHRTALSLHSGPAAARRPRQRHRSRSSAPGRAG